MVDLNFESMAVSPPAVAVPRPFYPFTLHMPLSQPQRVVSFIQAKHKTPPGRETKYPTSDTHSFQSEAMAPGSLHFFLFVLLPLVNIRIKIKNNNFSP